MNRDLNAEVASVENDQQTGTSMAINSSSENAEVSAQVEMNGQSRVTGDSNTMGIIEEEDSLDFSSSVRSQFPTRTPSEL